MHGHGCGWLLSARALRNSTCRMSRAICSYFGAISLHGPHHVAKKSTYRSRTPGWSARGWMHFWMHFSARYKYSSPSRLQLRPRGGDDGDVRSVPGDSTSPPLGSRTTGRSLSFVVFYSRLLSFAVVYSPLHAKSALRADHDELPRRRAGDELLELLRGADLPRPPIEQHESSWQEADGRCQAQSPRPVFQIPELNLV